MDDHDIETEEQFWKALGNVLTTPCPSVAQVDDALRGWLYLSAKCRETFLFSEEDIAICSSRLLVSPIFQENPDYVRMQIIYSLLGEDDTAPLHMIANFLLLDGRNNDDTFPRMIEEGCFPKLLELVGNTREHDPRLHRLLLELMYEMSRIQRLRPNDLLHVEDELVCHLFDLIEGGSDDVSDPYHYPVIRVLLVLNEQYMVASTATAANPESPSTPYTNRVIKVLCLHGPQYRTFGENIILLLNRETETSLQLLILKLLYLLFTTRSTYEYFYTNDLRVLLDVIIRNLLDLPDERSSLRHTYLRVLAPLLSHTQLSQPPHYKQDEILKLLRILRGSGSAHFAPADDTTVRLVERVAKVKWLAFQDTNFEDTTSPIETPPPSLNKRFLGISLSDSQTASSASIIDVVAVTEKPGVKTPSRATSAAYEKEMKEAENSESNSEMTENKDGAPVTMKPLREKPEVPRHRHGTLLNQPPKVVVNGAGPTKRLPPKVPPPRRKTKIRPVMSSVDPSEV